MKVSYAVVFERAPSNYGGYVPELLGCISVGDTLEEMRAMIREAIEVHIESMQLSGKTVNPPKMSLCDAMRYHIDLVTEDGEEPDETETIFTMIEVDAALTPEPVLSGEAPSTSPKH